MPVALILALALFAAPGATPFEDIHHRFRVSLPPGWQFAPQPGDTGGATFRRAADGALLNGMVRVMSFTEDAELGTFAERIAAASTGEPGYRQLWARDCRLAGLEARCRRYVSLVNSDPHLMKMAEQRVAVRGHTGYVVHAEALAEAFVGAERDIDAFLGSLSIGRGAASKASARHPHMADLFGRWRSRDGAHALQLTATGSILLDDARGTYRVEMGTLVASFADDTQIFGLDFAGEQLVLSGGAFGDGAHFIRSQGQSGDDKAHAPGKAKEKSGGKAAPAGKAHGGGEKAAAKKGS